MNQLDRDLGAWQDDTQPLRLSERPRPSLRCTTV